MYLQLFCIVNEDLCEEGPLLSSIWVHCLYVPNGTAVIKILKVSEHIALDRRVQTQVETWHEWYHRLVCMICIM